MDKKTVKLEHGDVDVYTFENIILHAYKTNDPLCNESFLLVKGKEGFVIELPPFKDNIREFSDYISTLGISVEGKIVSYHGAGKTFLPSVPIYSTVVAEKYTASGNGHGLINNFVNIFGEAFDGSVDGVDKYLADGKNVIAGIEIKVRSDTEAFEIEIPEIKSVYVHMLGHDCHSIVAGSDHADSLIMNIQNYLDEGYELILSSHYVPETRHDAETKLAYLENLKSIAKRCSSAEEFKSAVKSEYPEYSGENYLDMTAGMFF